LDCFENAIVIIVLCNGTAFFHDMCVVWQKEVKPSPEAGALCSLSYNPSQVNLPTYALGKFEV
jgi:hypothetical protein